MQPCTLLTVPTSGSLPPVADHGLCAGLVHPVMAAGHIGVEGGGSGVPDATCPLKRWGQVCMTVRALRPGIRVSALSQDQLQRTPSSELPLGHR